MSRLSGLWRSISGIWTRSVRRQLMIGVALVHALLMGLFVLDLVERQRTFLNEEIIAKAESLVAGLAATSTSWVLANDLAGLEEVVRSLDSTQGLEFAAIIDPSGRVLAHSRDALVGRFIADETSVNLLRREPVAQRLVVNTWQVDVAAPVLAGGRMLGWARLGLNKQAQRENLQQLARSGMLYTVLAIAIGSIISAFIAWRLSSGLEALVRVIDAVRAGSRNARADESRIDEIGRLGAGFNAMLSAVRESEGRFRNVANFTQEWEYWSAPDDRMLWVSPSCERVTGYTAREFAEDRQLVRNIVHPEDAGMFDAHRRRRHPGDEDKCDMDLRIVRKDGTVLWVNHRCQNIYAEDGEYLGRRASNRDITERKQAEEALRRSEEKLSRLFRLSPDAIILVDMESERIRDINEMFLHVFGYEPADVLGRTTEDIRFYANADDRAAIFAQLRGTGGMENREVEARRKDGSTLFCSLSGHVLELDGVQHVMTIARDITEVKKMQAVMVQTEKMVSVGGIAAGIAHEINNPLSIVLQASQNLAQRLRPDVPRNIETAEQLGLNMELLAGYMRERKVDGFIKDIQAAAVRAAGIIRNMLDFSRKSESVRRMCSLPEIVDKAVNLAASDYDLGKSYDFKLIAIDRDYEDCLPMVMCTETEIEQVVLNLLRNAAQAMSLCNPPTERPRIRVRLARADGGVRMEVQDNGPGMPPEIQRRVFEPFFTTKAPGVGTGLGLSVSYFIITKGHGGAMRVESSSGEGARFIIELPVATDK